MENSGQSLRESLVESNAENTAMMNFNSKLKCLPNYLINLLKETGYYNECSFLSINEKDIEEIEKFACEQLHLLVDKKDYVQYYGPLFSKKPEVFKILRGFKKQIFELSQQLQKETKAGNKDIDDKKKICHKRKRDDLFEENSNSTSDSITRTKTIDLHLEIKKIKKLILDWIQQKINTASDTNENDDFIKEAKNIKIKVEVRDENFIFATVNCFLCNTSIKIIKSNKNENNTSTRWMVSNFYKHFLKHLNSTSIVPPFKKSSSLTSYFSKIDANKKCKDLDIIQNKESKQGSSLETSVIIPVEDIEETEKKTWKKILLKTVVEKNNSNSDSDTESSNFL